MEEIVGPLGENARMAWEAIGGRPTRGIPQWVLHVMDIALLEELAGAAPGAYRKDPAGVYLDMQRNIGTCFIDQFIPDNPLTMSQEGFDSSTQRTATTGAETIQRDGMVIDSPEAAVGHMERLVFPALRKEIAEWDSAVARRIEGQIARERQVQKQFGPGILKVPYDGFGSFPHFRYGLYGYANYFMAYALYPEVMAKDFALQADLCQRHNAAAARAIVEGGLPPLVRLDHDMTDARGPLVSVRSLEQMWFPQFARAIRPLVEAGVRLIWHSDGNIMEMAPRLVEAGVSGFQGFQYEDGVDYPAICRMTDRQGRPMIIWAGVSVTRTLPFGTRQDVIDQLTWLVRHGPRVGLVLGGSSSIVPNTNRDNIRTLIQGLNYYRTHGREE